jgi:tRNA(adenine34) deaminase
LVAATPRCALCGLVVVSGLHSWVDKMEKDDIKNYNFSEGLWDLPRRPYLILSRSSWGKKSSREGVAIDLRPLPGGDEQFMRIALEEARRALGEKEVPVGAVLVFRGEVIGRGRNRPVALSDPTAHAEILALRRGAIWMGNYRLPDSTLYVTVEPCIMCAGAILQARVRRLVFGAEDPKGGAVRSLYPLLEDERLNHRVEVTSGVLLEECREILRCFFQERR